mmetsp:Transcript_40113/g.95143  ORF Transcript_40113/g.95143 Transcript_40113/m.95143 type:complete len:291 (-) Transcript_40113:153-1025(-)
MGVRRTISRRTRLVRRGIAHHRLDPPRSSRGADPALRLQVDIRAGSSGKGAAVRGRKLIAGHRDDGYDVDRADAAWTGRHHAREDPVVPGHVGARNVPPDILCPAPPLPLSPGEAGGADAILGHPTDRHRDRHLHGAAARRRMGRRLLLVRPRGLLHHLPHRCVPEFLPAASAPPRGGHTAAGYLNRSCRPPLRPVGRHGGRQGLSTLSFLGRRRGVSSAPGVDADTESGHSPLLADHGVPHFPLRHSRQGDNPLLHALRPRSRNGLAGSDVGAGSVLDRRGLVRDSALH